MFAQHPTGEDITPLFAPGAPCYQAAEGGVRPELTGACRSGRAEVSCILCAGSCLPGIRGRGSSTPLPLLRISFSLVASWGNKWRMGRSFGKKNSLGRHRKLRIIALKFIISTAGIQCTGHWWRPDTTDKKTGRLRKAK